MKRAIDLVLSVASLVLLAPALLAIGVGVWLALGSPVLFRQVRVGRGGAPFRLIKFRTMTDARDSSGQLLEDARRLTPFGLWLRRWSLDELPELLNVVSGQMSLVGPRPLPMPYLPLYSLRQARRHDVPPGLTGWAQVKGRNSLSWSQRFELDVWYVEHRSLWLDVRILAMSVWCVIHGDGISQPGHATMPPFTGNAP